MPSDSLLVQDHPASSRSLAGLSVLIVEDEIMLGLALQDIVQGAGCRVAGSAVRLADAEALAARVDCDLAILDINLCGERVDPAADALLARGVPILFATGYGENGVADRHGQWPVVNKPYTSGDVERAMRAALMRGAP